MMTAIPASKKAAKTINDQLQCLIEVFPTWKADDLNAVLNEVGGDAYLAINRISEGHVNQWSDGKKSSSEDTFSAQKNQRKPRNEPLERKPFVKRVVTQEPSKKVLTSSTAARIPSKPEVSWDSPAPSNAKISSSPSTSKTSFADALSSSTKPAPIQKPEKVEVEVAAVVVENVEAVAVVEEPIAAPVLAEPEVVAKCEEVCACNAEVIEDDFVVQLPSRPNIPSLTMEQPAVILPIRVPMRTGLSVRFGFDREEGVDAPSVNTSSLTASSELIAPTEHISATKTSISVAALESSFAMLSATESSKSPEPAFFETPSAPTYLHHHHQSSASSPQPQVSAYSRGRSGWDYEAPSNSSFGPAPGFSGSSTSASNVAPHMNRNHYESGANRYASSSAASSYNDYQTHQAEMNQSFMTATGANNNVSQYYTSNTGNRSNTSTSYPPMMYNRPSAGTRYSTGLNRPNSANVASSSSSPASSFSTAQYYQPQQQHYANPYSTHQTYLAHQGYHHPSAAQDQPQQQQSHHHLYNHQPYYQPYQPPHQYLSNNNSNNTQNNL